MKFPEGLIQIDFMEIRTSRYQLDKHIITTGLLQEDILGFMIDEDVQFRVFWQKLLTLGATCLLKIHVIMGFFCIQFVSQNRMCANILI